MQKAIKAIITGATGMVGEGVLHECLMHPDVETVLIINRKTSGISHPKLKELIHPIRSLNKGINRFGPLRRISEAHEDD